MHAGLLIQYLLLALAVAWSLWYLVQRQFPELVLALRRRAALALLAHTSGARARAIARRILPVASADTGCAGAASGCGGCARVRR